MALNRGWLLDKSAYVRLGMSPDGEQWFLVPDGARCPSGGLVVPDLLVAATAERAGLTVLAVDKDFDLIASITGQPVESLQLS